MDRETLDLDELERQCALIPPATLNGLTIELHWSPELRTLFQGSPSRQAITQEVVLACANMLRAGPELIRLARLGLRAEQAMVSLRGEGE